MNHDEAEIRENIHVAMGAYVGAIRDRAPEDAPIHRLSENTSMRRLSLLADLFYVELYCVRSSPFRILPETRGIEVMSNTAFEMALAKRRSIMGLGDV